MSSCKAKGRIAIKASNSPLGGGSVRVYVGDKLVWIKRVLDTSMLLKAEAEVMNLFVRGKQFKEVVVNENHKGYELRLV